MTYPQMILFSKWFCRIAAPAVLFIPLLAHPSSELEQKLRPTFVWGESAWGEAFFALELDIDGDGLADELELVKGTNAMLFDSDGDGLFDGTEAALGTNPLAMDSDGDGFSDAEEESSGTDPLAINDFPYGGMAPALLKVFFDLSRHPRN